jgi:hypothetical protein
LYNMKALYYRISKSRPLVRHKTPPSTIVKSPARYPFWSH